MPNDAPSRPPPATRSPTPAATAGPDPGFGLLDAKLQPPDPLIGKVTRNDLLARLDDSLEKPVVLVSATVGSGKTTVLAQWAARSRRPFAWVSLDKRDNDPVVLLTYVAAALDRIKPIDRDLFEALSLPAASVEGTLIPRVAAAEGAIEPAFVLVLDDVHELTDPQCIDAVDAIVEGIPRGSQVVLSGRTQPSRRIGSLRARGLTLEIGQGELQMDRAEASELVASTGVELPDGAVDELHRRTEGWPAGLYLGVLSTQAGGTLAPSGDAFGGRNRDISDYIRSEVLAQLPEDEHRFLTQTSVLDRICGPLCDAVLETEGSAMLLDSLQRSNLFVVPLDQNREWFRYHRLFRELLQAELERSSPDLVRDLLSRASDWSQAHGATDDAVSYAQAAGDSRRVQELVLGNAQAEYRRGRAVTVDRWLDWIEEHGALETSPLMAVLGAWYSAIRGNSDRAARWADLATRALDDGVPADQAPQVEAWLALIRAVRGEGGVAKMVERAEFAETAIPRASPWWPTAAVILGLTRVVADDDASADDLFESVADAGGATGAENAASLALAERALLAIKRDDWHAAAEFVDQAERVILRSRMEAYSPNALVYAVAARVALNRQESDKARELLVRAQRLRPGLTHSLAVISIQARLELAAAYVALPDPAGARTLLREAGGLLRRGTDFGTLTLRAQELSAQLEATRSLAPGASTLTTAELRLLPLLTTHLTFPEIGERLFISRHTVKSQAMSVYRKLEVTSRSEAVERARSVGIL